jgi:hypothetical protein
MKGRCKLCLQDNKELRKSHFLPNGIYKILRDSEAPNPNPWTITLNAVTQTSRQVWAWLLCDCCEQRFSRNGEDWVIKHCLRHDGRFKLLDILSKRAPDVFDEPNPTRCYYAANIPEINVPAIAYFSASIFWRGSIYPWNDDGSIPIKLRPFQDQFRRYLMKENSFPDNCFLSMVVREGTKLDRLTAFPAGGRTGRFCLYRFAMPGLAFSLAVGKRTPRSFQNICLVHNETHPFVITPTIEPFLERDAVKLYNMGIVPQRRRRVT